MQRSIGACLCTVLLLQLQGPAVDASFWVNFQMKMTQILSTMQTNYDGEVVRQMENDFLIRMPPVSKTNLASGVATGKTSADGTLVVGYIKGKGHHRHTRCTGTVVGGEPGGLAVAVTGGLVADAEHTEGKAVIHLAPDIEEYLAKKSVGEHFDKGLFVDIATKPQYKPLRTRIEDGLEAFANR